MISSGGSIVLRADPGRISGQDSMPPAAGRVTATWLYGKRYR
jgi:hypothetical protein